MKRFWKTGWMKMRRWLFPNWKLAVPLALVSAATLFVIFTQGYEETPPAYAAYLLSCYALVAICGVAARALQPLWRWVTAIPLVAHWRADVYFRVRTGLALSFFVNLCYAGLRIISAGLYASVWEAALGGYYVLLCAVRFYLIRRTPKVQGERRYAEELRIYRRTGWLLMAVDLTLTGVTVQIIQDGQGYHYPGTMIYAMAAYVFYTISMAVANIVRFRRFRSPVLSAAKAVNLTTALVSIFSLETAMLAEFGGEPAFQQNMTTATGVGTCVLVLAIALYMVIRVDRPQKRKRGSLR